MRATSSSKMIKTDKEDAWLFVRLYPPRAASSGSQFMRELRRFFLQAFMFTLMTQQLFISSFGCTASLLIGVVWA